jgi:60S ribosome subunit biogenesis protein NIP7
MRPLSDEETRVFFEKLAKYIGKNVRQMLTAKNNQGEEYVFRLHKNKVYYLSSTMLKFAISIAFDRLLSVGICFGAFTKSGKFQLHVTCLDYLAQFAPYKVWVKPNSELSFLYGSHVLKNGLGRMTEDTPQYQGVVVMSMNNTPLGFGITARSTEECRALHPTDVVVFHQADVGEYLREEGKSLF